MSDDKLKVWDSVENTEFYSDPEFRSRYLVEDHTCERIAVIQDQINYQGRRHWWMGKLTSEVEGFPGEQWCLHIETPLKQIVMLLEEGDARIFGTITGIMIGREPAPDWIQRYLNRIDRGEIAMGRIRQCETCEGYYDLDVDWDVEKHRHQDDDGGEEE